jgi:hypothetical protein
MGKVIQSVRYRRNVLISGNGRILNGILVTTKYDSDHTCRIVSKVSFLGNTMLGLAWRENVTGGDEPSPPGSKMGKSGLSIDARPAGVDQSALTSGLLLASAGRIDAVATVRRYDGIHARNADDRGLSGRPGRAGQCAAAH